MQMPPGSAKSLQPRRDIDAVAKDILGFDNYVAQVDPNAEADALVLGHIGVAVDHRALDLHCAPHRIHNTWKFHQHAVAGVLYGAPAMLLDLWIDQMAEVRLEAFVCPLLVRAHQARVPRHIGGENGGQPAFDAFRGQSGAPQPRGPKRLSALRRILPLSVGAGIPFRLSRSISVLLRSGFCDVCHGRF
jgi:hypothetical protein